MDEALDAAKNAPSEASNPSQQSDLDTATAEEIAHTPEKLLRWRDEMRRRVSALEGRLRPELITDFKTKIAELLHPEIGLSVIDVERHFHTQILARSVPEDGMTHDLFGQRRLPLGHEGGHELTRLREAVAELNHVGELVGDDHR